MTGFPWGSLGYTQWENLAAIQISSIFGVHGVSFVIILFNTIIAELILVGARLRAQIKHVVAPLTIVFLVFVLLF